MRFSGIVGIIFILLCSDCATIVQINKDWKKDKCETRSLAIVGLGDKIKVDFEGTVEQEFGEGKKEILIQNVFSKITQQQIMRNTCFHDAGIDSFFNKPKFFTKSVSNASEIYKINIPIPESECKLANLSPDYILIFENLKIISRLPYSDSAGLNSPFRKTLRYKGSFVLWDNKQKQPVVYGDISENENSFGTVYSTWVELANMMIKDMFSKTPFLLQEKEVDYIFNKSTFSVYVFSPKFDLGKFKTGFIVTNNFIRKEIDASSPENSTGKTSLSDKSQMVLLEKINREMPGISIDSLSMFTKLFKAELSKKMSPFFPKTINPFNEIQSLIERRVRTYFRTLDRPPDSLSEEAIRAAKEDSLDYLAIFIPRYTVPKNNEVVEEIDSIVLKRSFLRLSPPSCIVEHILL
jgi:hypothetical protein